MKYLIQTIEGEIVHDFSFTLIRSFDYYKWLGSPKEYVLSETVLEEKGCVPVGSVEFVMEYLKLNYGLVPKAKNIPSTLLLEKYLKRKVFIGHEDFLQASPIDSITKNGEVFVKPMDTIKAEGFPKMLTKKDILEPDIYMFSEPIDIVSEYRCFIYNNNLLGINNYSGEFTIFPDVDTIIEMIGDYTDSPIAYTLDVGVIESGETVIIEVHDFFSCGLYGFADMKNLPTMYSRWIVEYLNKNKK